MTTAAQRNTKKMRNKQMGRKQAQFTRENNRTSNAKHWFELIRLPSNRSNKHGGFYISKIPNQWLGFYLNEYADNDIVSTAIRAAMEHKNVAA